MPGPVFISSTSAARRHGAYAIERSPAAMVLPIGTGVAAIVAQFPWGPDGVVVTPSGSKDLIYQVAPPGMDHTGSGFLSIMSKGWPTLKFVRVLGSGAAPASASLTNGTAGIVAVGARFKGYFGNSLIATVSNASNGNPNYFQLEVQVAGVSGDTAEVIDNLNFSGVGADSAPDLSTLYLTGSVTKVAAGRPANGSYVFSGGSDGAVSALGYTGTAGTATGGLSAFEGDGSIRHVFTDDPGPALRPAVNAALLQHVQAMGDRCAYINGNQSQTLSQVASDVSNYRSARVVYVDPWAYMLDDQGTKRLVPPASFAASVAAQLSPSTSIAWKDPEVIAMLSGVVESRVRPGRWCRRQHRPRRRDPHPGGQRRLHVRGGRPHHRPERSHAPKSHPDAHRRLCRGLDGAVVAVLHRCAERPDEPAGGCHHDRELHGGPRRRADE